MTTTTPTAIIARIVERLEMLQPNAAPTDRPFRRTRAPHRAPLRRWAREAGANGMLRLFDVRRDGAWKRVGSDHPTANLAAVPMLVTVAYPAKPTLFSLTEYADVEAMIEEDALQIHDEIIAPAALVAGHEANDVETGRLDQGDEDIWFQEFPFTAVFWTAQRL